MKTGSDLKTLAAEIERRANAKKDFIAPVTKLAMESVADTPEPGARLVISDTERLPLTALAHNQLAEYVDIPVPYYKRMLANSPALLAENVNEWLPTITKNIKGGGKRPDRRMVRTLDGQARALLSDGYRPLENEDLANAVLPVLADLGLLIISAEITETRFYLKAVDSRIERDVPTGRKIGDGSHVFFDTVSPAVTIRNSEVGLGMLAIETGVLTRMCTNLATFEACMRKYHTGNRAELSEEVYALLTDDTKRKTDAAIWAQSRDLVKAAFDLSKFDAICQRLQGAAEQKIEDDPVKVIERVAKRWAFTEDERTGVLRHLIEGGDLTRYGLHGAVTRTAEDIKSYDRATDFEKYGGSIIELPANDWEYITKKAA